jgi:DNA-binding protein
MAEEIQNNKTNGADGENTIYIGKKPTMNYVLAVVTQFNSGQSKVTIKARGNAISRAVDVAEIVRNRFMPGISSPGNESIKIGSEELANEDGTKSKVSFIQISAKVGQPGSAGESAQIDGQDNVIYIGKKPTMNYVLAVVTQFNSGQSKVTIKARGNAISKAVDVVEIARNRFITAMPNPSGEGIAIKSEEVQNEDGTKSKVSSMQIVLSK